MTDPAPPPGHAPIDSALPSSGARALAMVAIVVAGICGGLIGYNVAQLALTDEGDVIPGLIGLAGAVFAAGGVAIVSVLVLRAMGEWRTIQQRADSPDAPGRRPS